MGAAFLQQRRGYLKARLEASESGLFRDDFQMSKIAIHSSSSAALLAALATLLH